MGARTIVPMVSLMWQVGMPVSTRTRSVSSEDDEGGWNTKDETLYCIFFIEYRTTALWRSTHVYMMYLVYGERH